MQKGGMKLRKEMKMKMKTSCWEKLKKKDMKKRNNERWVVPEKREKE